MSAALDMKKFLEKKAVQLVKYVLYLFRHLNSTAILSR